MADKVTIIMTIKSFKIHSLGPDIPVNKSNPKYELNHEIIFTEKNYHGAMVIEFIRILYKADYGYFMLIFILIGFKPHFYVFTTYKWHIAAT